MNSSPMSSRPRQAGRLLNGHSPLHISISAREKERLAASIESTNSEKKCIDTNSLGQEEPCLNGEDSPLTEVLTHAQKASSIPRPRAHSRLTEPARDARDTAPGQPSPMTSRPASPYTANPPIDFDGLSWPSMLSPSVWIDLADRDKARALGPEKRPHPRRLLPGNTDSKAQ